GVLDLAQRFRIQRAAKIDAADFRPDHGMQPGNGNCPDPLSRDCHVSLPSPTIAPCNISGRPSARWCTVGRSGVSDRKGSTISYGGTAALRDFNPAYVGSGRFPRVLLEPAR